jgi:hypothetical protein
MRLIYNAIAYVEMVLFRVINNAMMETKYQGMVVHLLVRWRMGMHAKPLEGVLSY